MLLRITAAIMFVTAISLSSVFGERLEESAYIYDQSNLINEFKGRPDYVIDHKSAMGFEIYGPRGLKSDLRVRGIKFRDLDVENFIAGRFASNYPTYEEITAHLKSIHQRYPALTDLNSIGKTVEGRDLWMLQISKHVNDSIGLPEVKYISSMHGDEITGRESMMMLIDDLLADYGRDKKITALIDNTRIYIMPSMNPDGSFHVHRWNGNGKDLNRNFPDFSTEDNQDSAKGREPETAAVMAWQAAHHVALSANFHGGAEVVNYMWDTIPDDHPQAPLLKQLSLDYAGGVSYLKNSQDFENGITNGYAWYEVNGGMQDWSYYWYNDLQFTVELSNSKYPDYSTMKQFYKDNKASLIQFLMAVHQGAGFSLDLSDLSGTVEVTQVDGLKNIGSFKFQNGYFYKVLSPGAYIFTIHGSDDVTYTVRYEVAANKIYTNGNFAR